MAVTHAFVSAKSDGGDATVVRPSNWNADHAITGVISINGTTATEIKAYNTYTDASNYERGTFDWTTGSNTLTIGAQEAGTGTLRPVSMVGDRVVFGGGAGSAYGIINMMINAGVMMGREDVGNCGFIGYSTNGYTISTGSDGKIGFSSTAAGGVNDIRALDTALARNAAGVLEVNNGTPGTLRDLKARDITLTASSSLTPANNGELVIQATSNTSLTFKYKGSDGTVRSASLTLS